MKKYDEDLSTTLIFVSCERCSGLRVLTQPQAGLFSAITSAFILDVQPRLQPDTGEETAALLRVLIYKVDNTTFGNNPPTLPQWSGPPHTIVQVQAILYASLAASLLSALLAMLGKQWLNRYALTDMRGTAIERSQNRQRKLDGIVTWYFDYVMELLPLMLQAALLLLGCALARYLWGVDITVASVVLSVTSSGVILYILILATGAASESCPYQTPGSRAFRHLKPEVQRIFRSTTAAAVSFPSVVASIFRESYVIRTIKVHATYYHPWWSRGKIIPFLKDTVRMFPRALAIDIRRLGRAMIRPLVSFGSTVTWLFASLARRVYEAPSTPGQGTDQQTIALDLRCVSWMLRTSLDKAVRLSTLEHLATVVALPDFDPTLVADCFGVFIGCVNVRNCKVAIVRESEALATISATCFLRTFHYLSVTDPTSNVIANLRQRYNSVFPFVPDFRGLPFYCTMAKIHDLVNRRVRWGNYRPSAQGHVPVARDIYKAAQVEYQKTQHRKVPRWTLRFTLHSLSLDPLPPTSVVADCLSIIAIDLGCNMSNTGAANLDERCVHIPHMTTALTSNQRTSGAGFEPDNSDAQHND